MPDLQSRYKYGDFHCYRREVQDNLAVEVFVNDMVSFSFFLPLN